ncbi:hypothetical protein CALVIDRAFT_554340 [Calocera viscosa TUFC12733]|uniref:Snf7-domain-containing protein n=1 Tax=Calocera viscosa (strain TUFC12733) TaxID=1330018 RepID=A0A167NM73_CALVF|nr:hypothetical protein CALVIDRAFT_554340 [Calocera viscosa TUFC12733]
MASPPRPSFLPPTIPAPSPQRLHALYADFSRQKSFNPSSYSANVDWWRRALPEVVAHSQALPDHLVLDVGDKLVEELRTASGARPASLGTVALEMLESSSLYPLAPFLSAPNPIYPISDSTSLPWRIASTLVGQPLWYLLSQLRLVGDPLPAEESTAARWKRAKGKYILKANLEKAADAVLNHERSNAHVSITDRLYTPASFQKEFGDLALPGVTLSATDTKVLLKHLERDRRAIVTSNEIIKFLDEHEPESTTITQVDRGVLEMKLAIQRLEEQISEIDRRITERTSKVKESLGKKQQETALSYLRSRRQLEEVLAKRTSSLETLQTVLLRIEAAAGDVEVMKAYETSSATLRTLLRDPRLQRERVDQTMESMAEALADHREIERAVEMGGEDARAAAGLEIDEREIEKELEEIVREQEKEGEREREVRLPQPPSGMPTGERESARPGAAEAQREAVAAS